MYSNIDKVPKSKQGIGSLVSETAMVNHIDELLPIKENTSVNKSVVEIDKTIESSYIVECDIHKIEDYKETSNAEIISSFRTSKSEDKQLAYALFSEVSEKTSRLETLTAFNNRYPGNAIALEKTMGFCSAVKEHPSCNQQLVDKAVSAAGNNAAMWFAIAEYYASRNKPERVKYAFRELESAPFYNDSFSELISLYIDSLSGRPNESFTVNVLSAFGVVATQPIFIGNITKLCVEKPETDKDFLHMCLSLGITLEDRGKTMATQQLGMSFQKVAYKLQNNNVALQKLTQRISKKDIDMYLHSSAMNLAFYDQRLYRYWLDSLRNLGEKAASKLIVQEAINLSKNSLYNPCQ